MHKYKLSWLIEKRVIFMDLHGDLEIDEFRQLMIVYSEMVAAGVEPVHAIINVQHITSQMHKLNSVRQVIEEHRPPKPGFTVLIGGNAVTRFFVYVLVSMLFRLEVRYVKNMDEALKVLYRVDDTLADLPVNHSA